MTVKDLKEQLNRFDDYEQVCIQYEDLSVFYFGDFDDILSYNFSVERKENTVFLIAE